MLLKEDLERGKCGLCCLSLTPNHIQACAGGRTSVSCGRTIPVSLHIQTMWKWGPTTEFCWQRDEIGASWKFLVVALHFLHPPSFLSAGEMEGGPRTRLSHSDLTSSPEGFLGSQKLPESRSIWRAQEGIFGVDFGFCTGQELDWMVLVGSLPLRIFHNSKRDWNSHPSLPKKPQLYRFAWSKLWEISCGEQLLLATNPGFVVV